MTPALADLGRRIEECRLRHGFTERELLVCAIRAHMRDTGERKFRLSMTFDSEGGKWRHVRTRVAA